MDNKQKVHILLDGDKFIFHLHTQLMLNDHLVSFHTLWLRQVLRPNKKDLILTLWRTGSGVREGSEKHWERRQTLSKALA